MEGHELGREELSWQDYDLPDPFFFDFQPGAAVLDVGCGCGVQLRGLEHKGAAAIGLDPHFESLRQSRSNGCKVFQAVAERIPIRSERLDGLICKGVIPFTEEPLAFREISRVLRGGGISHCGYLSAGYYLRYLLRGSSWRFRVYGLRTLLNTWLYAATGHRLPGFLGDTVYQSRRRLKRYYGDNGLRLIQETPSRCFLGLSVFIYHTLEKVKH